MIEKEQYEAVCKDRFDEIITQLETLNKRLFKDNGSKSLQSRINDNAIWCSIIKWFTITVSGGFLLGVIGLLFFLIKNSAK